MGRKAGRAVRVLQVLGVVVLTTSSANADAHVPRALHFACTTSTGVDPARLSDICAGFLDALGSQPGYRVLGSTQGPLAGGPGLEIDVIRATATQLELVPTLVDAAGNRTTLPSAGIVVMDTAMTEPLRRKLFLDLLSQLPK